MATARIDPLEEAKIVSDDPTKGARGGSPEERKRMSQTKTAKDEVDLTSDEGRRRAQERRHPHESDTERAMRIQYEQELEKAQELAEEARRNPRPEDDRDPNRPPKITGRVFRVKEDRTLSINGTMTTLRKGGLVKEQGYGRVGIARLRNSGVELEEVKLEDLEYDVYDEEDRVVENRRARGHDKSTTHVTDERTPKNPPTK